MRCVEQELSVEAFLLDRVAGHGRGHGHAVAERLRKGEDVRHDPELLEGEVAAEAPEPGLRLVEDDEKAALVAQRLELHEIALRRHDDPGRTLDRLDNNRGRRAHRLAVVEAEAHVEARHVALVAAVLYRATVAVGAGDRHGADARRAVAAAPAIVSARRGPRGDAVPGAGQRDDLEAASLELRHAHCGLVRTRCPCS